MKTVFDRLRSASPEEAARRRFGLWALAALIVFLPVWWVWGADLAAAALRPFAGLVSRLFGLSGEITVLPGGGWSVGTRLTSAGQPVATPVPQEVLRRLLLGVPLVAAFLIAPPRPARPLKAALICCIVMALLFALSLTGIVWGQLARQLSPELATSGVEMAAALDQPALHPLLARIAILARYMGLSVAPLLIAIILWATLNRAGFRALAAKIESY